MSKFDEDFVKHAIRCWHGFTPAKESVSGLARALTQMSNAIDEISEKEDVRDTAAEPPTFQLVMDRLREPVGRK